MINGDEDESSTPLLVVEILFSETERGRVKHIFRPTFDEIFLFFNEIFPGKIRKSIDRFVRLVDRFSFSPIGNQVKINENIFLIFNSNHF